LYHGFNPSAVFRFALHVCARGLPAADGEVFQDVRPSVGDEVGVLVASRHDDVEVVHPALLPAGGELAGPFGIGRLVEAFVDGGWGALEDVEVLAAAGEMGYGLDGRGTRADDADPFVGDPVEPAAGVAAGVVVIPA